MQRSSPRCSSVHSACCVQFIFGRCGGWLPLCAATVYHSVCSRVLKVGHSTLHEFALARAFSVLITADLQIRLPPGTIASHKKGHNSARNRAAHVHVLAHFIERVASSTFRFVGNIINVGKSVSHTVCARWLARPPQQQQCALYVLHICGRPNRPSEFTRVITIAPVENPVNECTHCFEYSFLLSIHIHQRESVCWVCRCWVLGGGVEECECESMLCIWK